MTKTFTSAVVLQLVAEGRVELDRPVEDYLPGLFPDSFEKPVTVRQLLNYTSGIRSADGPDSFAEEWEQRFDVTDPREQIAGALAKGPEFLAGTAQHYLNINYTILGVLIEKLTGTTYERAVSSASCGRWACGTPRSRAVSRRGYRVLTTTATRRSPGPTGRGSFAT